MYNSTAQKHFRKICKKSSFPIAIRIIALILVITFVAQDISWASPDLFSEKHPQNNKLAPTSLFKEPASESIDRVYPALIYYEIEKSAKRIGTSVDKLSLEAVKTILQRYKDEPWLKYTESTAKDEILISFTSGHILRYYYPTKAGRLHVQCIMAKSLPAPAVSTQEKVPTPQKTSELSKNEGVKRIIKFIGAIEEGVFQNGKVIDLRGLPDDVEIILVGDLHARVDNLDKILASVLDKVKRKKAILIFLGDAIHYDLYSEYSHEEISKMKAGEDPDIIRKMKDMDKSIEIMRKIMDLKIDNPDYVYYTLGNHDIIFGKCVKYGIDQSAVYKEEIRKRYGDEYLRLYKEFIDISPIQVAADGLLANHTGGPVVGLSLDDMKNIKDKNGSQFLLAVMGRFKDTPDYIRDEREFGTYDVQKFRERMGQPKAVVVGGHSPRLLPPGKWYEEIAPNQWVIYAANGATGYMVFKKGEGIKFVDVGEPEAQHDKAGYGFNLKGTKKLPPLDELDRKEIVTVSRDGIRRLIALLEKIGSEEGKEVKSLLDRLFNIDTKECMKLKSTFLYMINIAMLDDSFRKLFLQVLKNRSNVAASWVEFALSDKIPTDSARYFDRSENQAIIVFNTNFFHLDKYIRAKDADAREAALHVRAERIIHELKHSNNRLDRVGEIGEESAIVEHIDIPLWQITQTLVTGDYRQDVTMQEKIHRLRSYRGVEKAMHDSNEIFGKIPYWLEEAGNNRAQLWRLIRSDVDKNMPHQVWAKAFNENKEAALPPHSSTGISSFEELKGQTVLIVGGTSEAGLDIVKKLYQENITIFKKFIIAKGLQPNINDKAQCDLFLKEGKPIRICLYDTEESANQELIAGLSDDELNQNTGKAILNIGYAPSEDIYHLTKYVELNHISPQLIINISSLGREKEDSSCIQTQKAFLEIATLTHLLKLMDDRKCRNLWQIFPYKLERNGVYEYIKGVQQKILDNRKDISSICSLEEIESLVVTKFIAARQKAITGKKDSTDYANYFITGLALSGLAEEEKKDICAHFLSYKLKKDFGVDNLQDLEGISGKKDIKFFLLDSYIPVIGYLFDDESERVNHLKAITALWVGRFKTIADLLREQNKNLVFQDSASKNPYHQISHTAVRYWAKQGKLKLLYRTDKSLYDPEDELLEYPQRNLKSDIEPQDSHVIKISDAIKNVRNLLEKAARLNKINYSKEGIGILDELAILGIDSGSPFVFCDLDRRVVRPIHIGSSREAVYMPLDFIDKAKGNQLESWILYAVGWLVLYKRHKDNYTPDQLQESLKKYSEMFLKRGSTDFHVTSKELNDHLLSLMEDYAIAKGSLLNKLYKDYVMAFEDREKLLVKFPGGFLPKDVNVQDFVSYWNELGEKILLLSEGFESLTDRLTARRLHPKWIIANKYIAAADRGIMPAGNSIKELRRFLRDGAFRIVISKFKQYFLGHGVIVQVDTKDGPLHLPVDILKLNREEKNSLISADVVDQWRASWSYNVESAQVNKHLSYFEKEVHLVCETYSRVHPERKKKIELYEKDIQTLLRYFKENYEKWYKRIEKKERIIRLEELPPLLTDKDKGRTTGGVEQDQSGESLIAATMAPQSGETSRPGQALVIEDTDKNKLPAAASGREYLQRFRKSDKPAINPSLTTLIGLVKNNLPAFLEKARFAQEAGASSLHLDIFDPQYVETDDGKGNMDIFNAELVKKITGAVTLPIDTHLMVRPSTLGGVDKFKEYINGFIAGGASFVSIHLGAFRKDRLDDDAVREVLRFIREKGAAAGLVINPDESAEDLIKFKDDFDFPLVMTVVPGAGGKSFDERGITNLKKLKDSGIGVDKTIAADGGISDKTIGSVVENGGKWLVVGSYYFGKGEKLKSAQEMKNAHQSLLEAAQAKESPDRPDGDRKATNDSINSSDFLPGSIIGSRVMVAVVSALVVFIISSGVLPLGYALLSTIAFVSVGTLLVALKQIGATVTVEKFHEIATASKHGSEVVNLQEPQKDAISQAVEKIVVSKFVKDRAKVKPLIEESLRRFIDPQSRYGKAILSELPQLTIYSYRKYYGFIERVCLGIVALLLTSILLAVYYKEAYSWNNLLSIVVLILCIVETISIIHFIRVIWYAHKNKNIEMQCRFIFEENSMLLIEAWNEYSETVPHEFGHFIATALSLKDPGTIFGYAFTKLAGLNSTKLQSYTIDGKMFGFIKARNFSEIRKILRPFIRSREQRPYTFVNGRQNFKLVDTLGSKYLADDDQAGVYVGKIVRLLFPDDDKRGFEFLISLFEDDFDMSTLSTVSSDKTRAIPISAGLTLDSIKTGTEKVPESSPAKCLGAIIKYCNGDFTKTFTVKELIDAKLRTKKVKKRVGDGNIKLALGTVRFEFNRLREVGVLDMEKDGRENRYTLTENIRNLSPPEKISPLLQKIQEIHELNHPDILKSSSISAIKLKVDKLINAVATSELGSTEVVPLNNLRVIEPDYLVKQRDQNLLEKIVKVLKTEFKTQLTQGITVDSLRTISQAVKELNDPDERQRIIGNIMYMVLKFIESKNGKEDKDIKFGSAKLLDKTLVGGVEVCGPTDITFVWEKNPDGSLNLKDIGLDAGGGSANTAKTFANQVENFAFVGLRGEGPIDDMRREKLASEHIAASLIPTGSAQKVNVLHIVNGEFISSMSSLGGNISTPVIDELLREVENMLQKSPKLKWLAATAGGKVLSNETPRAYRSIVEIAHKYNVQMLIDFKLTSTTKEEMQAVLDVKREKPSDIIAPNIEEFILILKAMGFPVRGDLSKDTISEEEIIKYSRELIKRYNLAGALIKRGKQGLILILNDGTVIKEPAIKVDAVSPTAAGDAVNAGFLLALVSGKSWEEAVHQANIFGAATVTLSGTQVATPEAIKKAMALAKEQKIQPSVKTAAATTSEPGSEVVGSGEKELAATPSGVYADMDDFAKRHIVGPLGDNKNSYKTVNELIETELPAALYSLNQIVEIRKWMDENGASKKPLIIWQNMRLGEMYPYFNEKLKKHLGIIEMTPDQSLQLSYSAMPIDKPLAQARYILIKEEVHSSNPQEMKWYPEEDADSTLRMFGVNRLRLLAQRLSSPVLMIDHSRKEFSSAHTCLTIDESRAGRQTLKFKDASMLQESLDLLKQDTFFIVLNSNPRPDSGGSRSYFDDVEQILDASSTNDVVVSNKKHRFYDIFREVYGEYIANGFFKSIKPNRKDAELDADIDNTRTLATSLADLYEYDAEKIIYTIRLDSSRIPGNYIELIRSRYAKILSAKSNNVEVKVLGNDKLKGLVDVSIESGGKVQGNGIVNIAGENNRVESLGRLVGMVNLAISVATIPEEFTDSGIDKYKGFLSIISAQYELLTGERLKLPEDAKGVSAFIRNIVMNLPPIKSCGAEPQEIFKLMEDKLESAA